MVVRSLKRIQLAVAIATTVASLTGLLLPGVMSLLLAPLALLYVIWAARATLNHRFSIWLSFASTIVVAVLVGALGVSMTASTFGTRVPSERVIAPVAVNPAGNVVEVPPEALARLEQMQARIDRRERAQALALLTIGLAAGLVVALYALEWRWAFTRQEKSSWHASSP